MNLCEDSTSFDIFCKINSLSIRELCINYKTARLDPVENNIFVLSLSGVALGQQNEKCEFTVSLLISINVNDSIKFRSEVEDFGQLARYVKVDNIKFCFEGQ